MNHVKVTPFILLLIALFVFAGCGGGAAPAAATPAATATQEAQAEATDAADAEATAAPQESAAESPLAVPASPLAVPASPLPTPETEAAPTSDAGSIVGRILIVKLEGEIAVADMIIGLAEVVRDEEGVARVGGYEPSRTLRVTTDHYGRFVMNGVKPGTYTLILDAVVTQYQLADEETGFTIMAEVEAGEVVDLGTLEYSSLPLPGLQ
jgi:hypothetical protein